MTAPTKPYTIALITTDPTATGEEIVARYASRWPIEQTIKDSKEILGAGDPQSRLPLAVERTTPFILTTLTILILWYHHAGNASNDLASHRRRAPWYRYKHHVSVDDMLVAFRRARITATSPARATTAQINYEATARAATAA